MDSFLKKHCSPEWQEFVNFHKSIYTYKKGEFIFKEGDKVEGLYILNQGKVKIVASESDKHEKLVRLAADGDVIGHRGFGGDWKYPVSAITYEETIVTFIPINIFNVLAKSNAEFTYHLMMFFANELRETEEKNTLIPVKKRVFKAILMNWKVFGADKNDPTLLSYTISRKDYANKVGTTYETIIRVFSELNKDKIICIEGKTIRILNFEALQQLALI